MLSRILDSHSQVACPFEFAVPALLGRGHWKYKAAVRKADVIASHYGLSATAVWDVPRFLPGRIARPLIKRRLNKFFRHICAAERKQRLVIKEPAHHEVVDKIAAMYGHESLLLLARGPLATATSLAKTFQDRHPLKTWADAHRNILRYAEQGVPLIRYEELVANPQPQVERACAALSVEFEPEMLAFGDHQHTDDKLTLWYRDSSDQELVGVSESKLHQTVAKGFIDAEHNSKRLQETPPEIVNDFRNDQFGALSLAKELGYQELSDKDLGDKDLGTDELAQVEESSRGKSPGEVPSHSMLPAAAE